MRHARLLLFWAALWLSYLLSGQCTAHMRHRRTMEAAPAPVREMVLPWEQYDHNAGLPSECLTYAQRYKGVRSPARMAKGLQTAGSKKAAQQAVLVKLHVSGELRQDFVDSLRAVAVEVLESGYQFFMLLDGGEEYTAQELQALFPQELQPFIRVHNFGGNLQMYPKLQALRASIKNAGPGPAYPYLAEVRFMWQAKDLEWLWVLEYDVRLLGHWGRFLNAAMHIAAQAKAQDFVDQELVDAAVPASGEPVPGPPADLILFDGVSKGKQWADTQTSWTPLEEVYYAPLMVYGASRKYWDTLHKVSLEGIGMYHEAMIPSTAIIANLKGAAIRLPKRGDTYHCCTHDASWLYGFYQNASACVSNLLLHPIKLEQDTWPLFHH